MDRGPGVSWKWFLLSNHSHLLQQTPQGRCFAFPKRDHLGAVSIREMQGVYISTSTHPQLPQAQKNSGFSAEVSA